MPEVSLTFLVVSLPDGGRRVLLGAGRPTEHPLPTPAGNPAGSRIHSSSHGSGFAFTVSSESRPLSFGMKAGTQSDLQGWACPGKSFDSTELKLESGGSSAAVLPHGRCAGCAKGESSASAGAFPKLFSRKRIARHFVASQLSSFRRNAGRLEEPGTRHGGFSQKPNGAGCDEWA